MQIVKPKRLKPGARIGLIAPSGPIIRDTAIEAGKIPDNLEKGLVYLKGLGYQTVLGKHCLKRRGYLAGSDSERVEDLHAMFADGSIDAIICLAGGYGTPRLLDQIDYDLIKKHPKIFQGYSDITALLNVFFQKTGLVTFHGPMANYDFGRNNAYNRNNIWPPLTQLSPLGILPLPENGPERKTIVPGKAKGKLVGGNLSLVISTLGTPFEIDTQDAILLLEDVDEYPYRCDRMLNQLALSGKLKQAKGFLIGECVDCVPNRPDNPSLSLLEVLGDHIKPLNKPAFYGYPCGHGNYKITLPIGIQAELDADSCNLSLLESAVID